MRQAPDDRNGEDVWYMCVSPRADRKVMRIVRDLAQDLTERKGKELSKEETEAIGRAAHVVDWENLRDDDGAEIECTPERVFRLLVEECPEYGVDVQLMMQLAAFRTGRSEAAEEGK
ncbi:MAG TPA: hypothetical protein VFG22_09265 [Polyangiales bacterium]|nr:hypothetical protein [Polyangiales bacterium]